MKKEVFIKLFYIEDSNVRKIELQNNDLIIQIETDVVSFAMGNNIRENDLNEVTNTYTFKNVKDISNNDLLKISIIYQTTCINSLICFDTNLGKVYFDCNEVFVE